MSMNKLIYTEEMLHRMLFEGMNENKTVMRS